MFAMSDTLMSAATELALSAHARGLKVLRFAASKRSPSTPSEIMSFAYAANVALTYSVSVARLAGQVDNKQE